MISCFIVATLFTQVAVCSADANNNTDTDDDTIPDALEKSFTVVNKKIVPWTSELGKQGFPRYMSNPHWSRTGGGISADAEQAFNRQDKGALFRNPMYVNCPVIDVALEGFIISPITDVSHEKGKTISLSTSTSDTNSNTQEIGVSASVHASLLDFGGSVQASTQNSHTSSHTTTAEHSSGQNWVEHSGYNTAHAFELRPLIRIYNAGSNTIYNPNPMLNFTIDGEPVATVKLKTNQIPPSLRAGEMFPKKGQKPLVISAVDDFGMTPITLNRDQLLKVEAGKDIQVEVLETEGNYGLIRKDGNVIVESWQSWVPVQTQIEKVAARIAIHTGRKDEGAVRYVAAKNAHDPHDTTPEMSLREAIRGVFPVKEEAGKLHYKNMSLDENDVKLIVNQVTVDEMKRQSNHGSLQAKKMYDTPLRAGMHIKIIRKPEAQWSPLVTLINNERSKLQLFPLKFDEALSREAENKAKEMDKNKTNDLRPVTSNSGQRYRDGWNFAHGDFRLEALVRTWMDDTDNRQNLLHRDYKSIGVARHKNVWVIRFKGERSEPNPVNNPLSSPSSTGSGPL